MAETPLSPEGLRVRTIQGDGVMWVNIEGPTEAEMAWLKERFGFHSLALDDCLSRVQVPKIDDYTDYLFLVLHFPVFDAGAKITLPEEVDIFVGPAFVVTVHGGRLRPLTSLFEETETDATTRGEMIQRSSGYLLYRVLDVLVDYCFPILNKAIQGVNDVEARVFDERSQRLVRDISVVRRDIIAFRRIIRPQIAVLEMLEGRGYPLLRVDPDVYFGDLADHIRRIWAELQDLREVIEGLSDAHSALTGHQTNQVIRILTIISTILLPLSLISGLYGMNVRLPFEDTPFAFAVVTGIMVAIAGTMLLLFRLRRWI